MALFGFRVKKFTCKRLHVFGKKISSQSQQLHTPTAVGPTNGPSPGPNFPHCYNQTRAIVSTEFFPLHQTQGLCFCIPAVHIPLPMLLPPPLPFLILKLTARCSTCVGSERAHFSDQHGQHRSITLLRCARGPHARCHATNARIQRSAGSSSAPAPQWHGSGPAVTPPMAGAGRVLAL